MQKGSALLFVILVVLVLVGLGGGYAYLNKPLSNPPPQITSQIPSSNKIYQNTALNFELQYAGKDLTVKEDTEQDFNKRGNGDFRKNFKEYVFYEPGKFLGAVVILDKSNLYETNPLTIWVFDNPEDLSIDKWYGNFWYYPFVWGDFTFSGKAKLAPNEEATISGQLAKSHVVDYKEGKPKFVYVAKDKRMHLFRIIGEEGEKILSTFKFQ